MQTSKRPGFQQFGRQFRMVLTNQSACFTWMQEKIRKVKYNFKVIARSLNLVDSTEAISRENTPDQRASLEISGSSSGYEDSLPSPQRRRAVSAIVGAPSYSSGDSSGVIQQTVSWEEAEAKVGYCITVVNMAGSPHFGNKRNDDDTIDVEEPNEIPLYAEVKKQPKLKL